MKPTIKTIGHRGAGFLEPENTLRGFRKAIELGLDYVEFDVQKCKSGELVVIHDETVGRTTNGKGFVKNMTLQQLKKLDAIGSNRPDLLLRVLGRKLVN